MVRIARVVSDEIDLQGMDAELTTAECGACVTFKGVVRNHAEGQVVESIEYSCYEGMVQGELEAVMDRVCDGHGVENAAVIHRVGHLKVGEVSLVVVVATPHRREAFECALEIIEEIKKTVPVWKKEIGPDGADWVQG